MAKNNLLTIKEFASLAGVSVQSIYKRLNNSLNPYVQLVESQKMLKKEALSDVYGIEVEQPFKPKLNNSLNLEESEEVAFLRTQVEKLQEELAKEREHNREKDKQLLIALNKLSESQVALTSGQAAEKIENMLLKKNEIETEENGLLQKKGWFSWLKKVK